MAINIIDRKIKQVIKTINNIINISNETKELNYPFKILKLYKEYS